MPLCADLEGGIYLCVVVVGFAGMVRSRANSLTRRPPHPSRPPRLAVTAASTAADSQAAARNARLIADVHGVADDRNGSVESSSNPFPRESLRFHRVVVSRPTSTNQRSGIRRGAAPLYSCLPLDKSSAQSTVHGTASESSILDRLSSCLT